MRIIYFPYLSPKIEKSLSILHKILNHLLVETFRSIVIGFMPEFLQLNKNP